MMRDVYGGIFVKDFTLFYGEKLTYTLTVEQDGKPVREKEQVLTAKERTEEDGVEESRYRMLNDMSRALADHQESQVKRLAEKYLEREKIVEKIFTLS